MSEPAAPRTWRALRAVLAERLGEAREATRLVAALHHTTPAMVVARGDTPVDAVGAAAALAAAERLRAGEPFAYVVGRAPFRHLDLAVDARVLIPRPETETVVEHALAVAGAPGGVAADVGTGSGAIALALAQEGRFARVIATDVSADALDVARANAARLADVLHAPVTFRLGADLAPLAGERLRLLVSNPPYIAADELAALPASVRDWEPWAALGADANGLARSRAILAGAPAVVEAGGHVVLELDARRAGETVALAERTGRYDAVSVHDDLFGRPRVLVARVAGADVTSDDAAGDDAARDHAAHGAAGRDRTGLRGADAAAAPRAGDAPASD